MKVKRYPKALQFGPDRPELRFIEIVPKDVVVVQNSLEPEILHSPTQLDHGGSGILQWQGRERGKPIRVSGDRLGKVVVDLPGYCHGRGGGGDDFHPRRQGEYLHVHAVRVHVRQAELCHVRQAPGPLLKPPILERNDVPGERRSHARDRGRFFDSNDTKDGNGFSMRNHCISDSNNANGLDGFAHEIAAAKLARVLCAHGCPLFEYVYELPIRVRWWIGSYHHKNRKKTKWQRTDH